MSPRNWREVRVEVRTGYDVWLNARTNLACLDSRCDECDGLAYDYDEHRVIACLCGCHAANDTEDHIVRGAE